MRNAVRDIAEFIRRVLVEVTENAVFDDVAVQFGNAVDVMRTHDAEICHAHGVVCENRHTGNAVPISGEMRPEIFAETTVDLFEDVVDTRDLRETRSSGHVSSASAITCGWCTHTLPS